MPTFVYSCVIFLSLKTISAMVSIGTYEYLVIKSVTLLILNISFFLLFVKNNKGNKPVRL